MSATRQSKQYLVRQFGSVLRFYESDKWTADLVQSMVSTGSICFHSGFWHLSFAHDVSAFDEDRLNDLCSDIICGGRVLDDLERFSAIKYYSSVGVYDYGTPPPRRII